MTWVLVYYYIKLKLGVSTRKCYRNILPSAKSQNNDNNNNEFPSPVTNGKKKKKKNPKMLVQSIMNKSYVTESTTHIKLILFIWSGGAI